VRGLNKIALIITFLITIFSCGQGYIVNINSETDYPEGRNLFISKCGGCHQLFDPNSYSEVNWHKIMMEMQKKSKINDQQKNEIYNWILETRQTEEMLKAKNNY